MYSNCIVFLWGAVSICAIVEAKLFANLFGNKEHIKHDFLDLFGDWFDLLNDAELDFRYFIAHDYDKNKKLDGLELLAAFTHEAGHKNENSQDSNASHGGGDGHDLPLHDAESHVSNVEECIIATGVGRQDEVHISCHLIDEFLSVDDDNKDGFLDYREFSKVVKRYPSLGDTLS